MSGDGRRAVRRRTDELFVALVAREEVVNELVIDVGKCWCHG